MARSYNFGEIEKKWRGNWEKNPVNVDDGKKKQYYCLDMFPYPSGSGLHVGHWRGYVLSDAYSRYKVLNGYHVLHPMGWDAFGLPAENFAIKNKVHPKKATADNIANVKRQLHEISAIYNWDNELDTTDPGFYKWTQWIFAKMFENGLAYEKEMPLNWCPGCNCVLANEEATSGVCERCGTEVTKKMLRQWMLKITKYAERLLVDLDKLDWPAKVKKMQTDWIGKSYGADVDFKVDGKDMALTVFTTRPDTLFGTTFMVVAPEHTYLECLTTPEQKEAVDAYVKEALAKSSIDRIADREKTGVFTGSYCINPMNNKKIPIWVADYALIDYGTGAVMGSAGHDQRDFDFAKKFGLEIIRVIAKNGDMSELKEAYTGDGVLVNSEQYDGLSIKDGIEKTTEYLESTGRGRKTINYKLRDWVFSRQRYWGEPIPIVHCEKCGPVAVPDEQLPVLLPMVESYLPTSTGESPLAAMTDWVNTTCPKCGGPGKRETNTMPQWAGSSWYFLRYPDNHNDKELASKEQLEKYLPVDTYVGGIEHAVLHLLYSRFYVKFLYDIGVVSFDEPFLKLFNQGMILKDGKKMSKSAGNVVSPDELVRNYGCDSLRMYELFVGPPELESEWDDRGIEGVFRYLNKAWKFVNEYSNKIVKETPDMVRLRNRMSYEITKRIESLSMNTVISGFMEYTTRLTEICRDAGGIDMKTLETLLILLSPFAPHISEEMWEITGHNGSIFEQKWPAYDEEKMKDNTVEIAIQVNGKLRGSIQVARNSEKDDVLIAARKAVSKRLDGVTIVKEIYVPNKIVSFVVK